MEHPEWKTENSLTEPKYQTTAYINGEIPIEHHNHTEEEIREATRVLNINKPIEKFKRIEKLYADPPIQGQSIALFSFTPARGAKPDEDGIYGMIKCRGAFATQREANERADYIFRNVDTYHKLFHCQVGRPFPLTFNESFFEEKEEVELKKKVSEEESAFLKMSREEEDAVKSGLKDRMKTIKEEMENPKPPTDIQAYITLQVKRASLQAHIQSLQKAMEQYQESCDALIKNLKEYDEKTPELKQQYIDDYLVEAQKVGIEADPVFMGFLKNW